MIDVGFIKLVADLQYILFVFTRFEISRQYGPIRTDGEVVWVISEHHVLRVSDLIRPLTINPLNKLEIYNQLSRENHIRVRSKKRCRLFHFYEVV